MLDKLGYATITPLPLMIYPPRGGQGELKKSLTSLTDGCRWFSGRQGVGDFEPCG